MRIHYCVKFSKIILAQWNCWGAHYCVIFFSDAFFFSMLFIHLFSLLEFFHFI